VVIGGVLSSALLSLLFVPAGLFLLERRRDRRASLPPQS
jgi:Cu/Ag efflux pump CusA